MKASQRHALSLYAIGMTGDGADAHAWVAEIESESFFHAFHALNAAFESAPPPGGLRRLPAKADARGFLASFLPFPLKQSLLLTGLPGIAREFAARAAEVPPGLLAERAMTAAAAVRCMSSIAIDCGATESLERAIRRCGFTVAPEDRAHISACAQWDKMEAHCVDTGTRAETPLPFPGAPCAVEMGNLCAWISVARAFPDDPIADPPRNMTAFRGSRPESTPGSGPG